MHGTPTDAFVADLPNAPAPSSSSSEQQAPRKLQTSESARRKADRRPTRPDAEVKTQRTKHRGSRRGANLTVSADGSGGRTVKDNVAASLKRTRSSSSRSSASRSLNIDVDVDGKRKVTGAAPVLPHSKTKGQTSRVDPSQRDGSSLRSCVRVPRLAVSVDGDGRRTVSSADSMPGRSQHPAKPGRASHITVSVDSDGGTRSVSDSRPPRHHGQRQSHAQTNGNSPAPSGKSSNSKASRISVTVDQVGTRLVTHNRSASSSQRAAQRRCAASPSGSGHSASTHA
jgi:hypothetical protein